MKKFLFTFVGIVVVFAGYFFIKNMPNTATVPSNRLSYSGEGITFQYPETLGANVWKTITWPPKVTVVDKGQDAIALGCPALKDSGMIVASGKGKINGVEYTFSKGEDIGAGQLYTSTCYLFSGTRATYVIDFEIHSHSGCGEGNCGAYCETDNEQECRDFDMLADVEKPIDTIISTVYILQ